MILAEGIDNLVEGRPRPTGQRRLLARTADSVYDVMPLLPFLYEQGYQLRRILEVSIDLNDSVSACLQVAGEYRPLKSKVLREPESSHPIVNAGDLLQLGEGVVGAVIVGEH